MIDVESLVFDTVFNAVKAVYPDTEITKGFVEETATYPCVVIRETNNVPVNRMATDECSENYSRLTYQVDVYSVKTGTAQTECRELLKLVDSIMTNPELPNGMKFRRIHMNEPLNISRTTFRQYARYSVIVDKGVTTEEEGETTTIFQMYRR